MIRTIFLTIMSIVITLDITKIYALEEFPLKPYETSGDLFYIQNEYHSLALKDFLEEMKQEETNKKEKESPSLPSVYLREIEKNIENFESSYGRDSYQFLAWHHLFSRIERAHSLSHKDFFSFFTEEA
jgi:hypothetical protein